MSYPKLNSIDKCAYPERIECNYSYDGKTPRCQYMKYRRGASIFDPNRWECIFKKDLKE